MERTVEGPLFVDEMEGGFVPSAITVDGVYIDRIIGEMLEVEFSSRVGCPVCTAKRARITIEILER